MWKGRFMKLYVDQAIFTKHYLQTNSRTPWRQVVLQSSREFPISLLYSLLNMHPLKPLSSILGQKSMISVIHKVLHFRPHLPVSV